MSVYIYMGCVCARYSVMIRVRDDEGGYTKDTPSTAVRYSCRLSHLVLTFIRLPPFIYSAFE